MLWPVNHAARGVAGRPASAPVCARGDAMIRVSARLLCARGVALLLAVAAGGCTFGPKALERSHGRYNEAVRQVDEEQLLRNIVHLRYDESPLNLNVASIAAQYELSASAEARPFFIAPNPSNSNVIFRTFTSILPDLMLGGSNRPTISLDPADDSDAIRQSFTPITLGTLTLLTQSGWPVSSVLRLWVDRLNGVPNAVGASGPPCGAAPDFARFLRIAELAEAAQTQELLAVRTEERAVEVGGPFPADAVTAAAAVEAAKNGLHYRRREGGTDWVLVRNELRLVIEVSPGAESRPEVVEFVGLLNLVPGQRRYDIVLAGRGLPDPTRFPVPPVTEVRAVPRSTIQVLFYLANGVEVPAEHLNCGLVHPAVGADGVVLDNREITRGLFEVHVWRGKRPPPCAYVAVPYRGYWYYIDDRDLTSKATFLLVLELSRLDFARRIPGTTSGPVLTLPAGR
jgi:hypothetical protein